MGKMRMGNGGNSPAKPAEPKTTEEIPVKEPEHIIIETVREVPVYIDRIQEIAIPAQIIEKEIVVEKFNDDKLIQFKDEFDAEFIRCSLKMDALASKVDDINKKVSEAYEDCLKHTESLAEAIDMSDRTFVAIRQIQASQDETLNTLKDKIEKQQKYNKYLMLGIAITACLAIVASII